MDTALKKYTDFLTMPLQRNTHNTNRLHQIIAKDIRKMQPINNFPWQKDTRIDRIATKLPSEF